MTTLSRGAAKCLLKIAVEGALSYNREHIIRYSRILKDLGLVWQEGSLVLLCRDLYTTDQLCCAAFDAQRYANSDTTHHARMARERHALDRAFSELYAIPDSETEITDIVVTVLSRLRRTIMVPVCQYSRIEIEKAAAVVIRYSVGKALQNMGIVITHAKKPDPMWHAQVGEPTPLELKIVQEAARIIQADRAAYGERDDNENGLSGELPEETQNMRRGRMRFAAAGTDAFRLWWPDEAAEFVASTPPPFRARRAAVPTRNTVRMTNEYTANEYTVELATDE